MTPAEFAALVNGTVLVVEKDFKNPEPDRRTSHDWRKAPVIKKGTRLVIVKQENRLYSDLPFCVELRPVSTWRHQYLLLKPNGEVPGSGAFKLLTQEVVKNVKVDKHDLDSTAAYHYVDAKELALAAVREMLYKGTLTLIDVEELYLADRDRED